MASFLDLFGVVDSDGVSPARYRLHFTGSSFSNQDSWIFGMLTELVYMLFQAMVIPANALLGTVLDSRAWLDPLASFYQRLTAPLFAVFPPWAIACFGLGLVTISIFMSRAWVKSLKLGSEDLNRAGGALAMVVMVLVLTNNPFALVAKLLELANGFAGGLAEQITGRGSSNELTTGTTLVDASIRTPTIALNYGRTLDGRCLTQWSESMVTGQTFAAGNATGVGCLTPGDDVARPSTLATALMMLLLPALPMLAFCAVAAWKYLVHLTMSVLCLLATGWVAAISVHRRRGFDRLAKTFGHCVAHLVMTVVTSMIAVALPAACAKLGVQLLGMNSSPQTQAYALMVSLGIGFGVSTWVIWKVTSNHGVLVRALHADVNSNLEKIFGLTPDKFAFGFHNVKALFGGGNTQAAGGPGGKNPVVGKKSPLAADPIAATASKNSRLADGPKVASGDTAVAQLITAAQSVADSTPVSPVSAGGSETVPPKSPSHVAAPSILTEAGIASRSTTVLALTTKVAAAAAAPPTSAANADGSVIKVPPAGDLYGYFAPRGKDVTSTTARESAGNAFTTAEELPTVLADPPQMVLPGPDQPPLTLGLRGANPELEAVAQLTGVNFVPAERPKTTRRLSNLLRRFQPGPPTPAPAGAVPDVVYGPPLAVADTTATAGTGLVGKAKKVAKAAAANVQQGWKRHRPGCDAGPATGDFPALTQPDPGSYIAPKVDFLAGDDLEAQIEQARIVAAAAGQPITVEIDPDDTRIGIALSSDPDERIRSSNPSGFGDPI